MNIRPATLDDLAQLRTLEQGVVEAERPFNTAIKDGSPTYYDLNDLITSEDSLLLVIEVTEEIIATGYIQIRQSKQSLRHDRHGYLGFMFVAPEQRGKGLNHKIIDALINWGEEKGVSDFYLDVYFENQAAIRAYEKVGFSSSMIEMKYNKPTTAKG